MEVPNRRLLGSHEPVAQNMTLKFVYVCMSYAESSWKYFDGFKLYRSWNIKFIPNLLSDENKCCLLKQIGNWARGNQMDSNPLLLSTHKKHLVQAVFKNSSGGFMIYFNIFKSVNLKLVSFFSQRGDHGAWSGFYENGIFWQSWSFCWHSGM